MGEDPLGQGPTTAMGTQHSVTTGRFQAAETSLASFWGGIRRENGPFVPEATITKYCQRYNLKSGF